MTRTLIAAIRDENRGKVQSILSSSYKSINQSWREPKTQMTPFLRACLQGDFHTARSLLFLLRPDCPERRAVDRFGYNCLHLAAIGGKDARFVDLLVIPNIYNHMKSVVHLQAVTPKGESALTIATRRGNLIFASFIKSIIYPTAATGTESPHLIMDNQYYLDLDLDVVN